MKFVPQSVASKFEMEVRSCWLIRSCVRGGSFVEFCKRERERERHTHTHTQLTYFRHHNPRRADWWCCWNKELPESNKITSMTSSVLSDNLKFVELGVCYFFVIVVVVHITSTTKGLAASTFHHQWNKAQRLLLYQPLLRLKLVHSSTLFTYTSQPSFHCCLFVKLWHNITTFLPLLSLCKALAQ